MTQFLPPNLLALFAARDPIPYLPPAAKLPHEKKQKGYDGVGAFLNVFEVSFDDFRQFAKKWKFYANMAAYDQYWCEFYVNLNNKFVVYEYSLLLQLNSW